MVFCRKCGTNLASEDVSFCPKCGFPTKDIPSSTSTNNAMPQQDEKEKKRKSSKTKTGAIVAVVAAIAVMAILAVLGYMGSKNLEKNEYCQNWSDRLDTNKAALEADIFSTES